MLIDRIAEPRVFADGIKIAGNGVLAPVMADCRNAECRAVRACPYNIRSAEPLNDVISRDRHDVGIQVNVFKVLVPLDRKHFVTVGFKGLADASCPGEKFKNLHSM